jgi:DNA topoisomerase IB
MIDGHKYDCLFFFFFNLERQKIGNFRIEPPGLFRGRGEHPKQGLLKSRVRPEDIVINCGEEAKVCLLPLDSLTVGSRTASRA